VSSLKADPYVINLDRQVQTLDLEPSIEILEDRTKQLSVQHLLKNQVEFIQDWQPARNVGYSLSTWWIRFDLVNYDPSNRYWYLQLQEVDPKYAQVYIFPTQDKDNIQAIPPIHELRRVSFRLELLEDSQYSVYIAFKNPDRPVAFDLKLLSPDALVKITPSDHIIYALVLGALFIMSLYNLLTFFGLRDRTYLSLAIFIFSNSIALASQTGMLGLLFNNINPNYTHAVAALITIASSNSFFYYLMNIPERFPNYANLYRINFWLAIFVAIIVYILPFAILYPSILGTLLLFMSIPVIWILYRANVPEARSFVVAFIVVTLSCAPILLYAFGVVHNWTVALAIFMIGFVVFVVLLSLTQSRRTLILRHQAQQIEAASKAKDSLLMTMSHELRTPMHAVVSSGTLLQKTALTKQQSGYVEKLQISAQHMLNLINNILDVSRLSHAQPELQVQPFKLKIIFQNLEKLLNHKAQQKGLNFDLVSDYPEDSLLLGDVTKLSQVLLNLLDNALKFTEQGSISLTVNARGQWLSKIELSFIVADTGIGLSLQEQERLFEPFFQASSSNSRRYSGTGLGLTISHHLVQQLGGELKFKSKQHQGTSFFFNLTFPLAELNAPTHEPAAATSHDYQAQSILLVDDDPLNQFFGKELLTMLGVQVDLASSGSDSLLKLRQAHYDLVFMDISMPDLDGYQTTQLIRHDLGLHTLPIVALTAHALSGERERCLAAGMNDYLAKPFNVQDLDAMLARWLKDNKNNSLFL
jgi:signal transduction histidine kinase/CheY-like chemotaxis protein